MDVRRPFLLNFCQFRVWFTLITVALVSSDKNWLKINCYDYVVDYQILLLIIKYIQLLSATTGHGLKNKSYFLQKQNLFLLTESGMQYVK